MRWLRGGGWQVFEVEEVECWLVEKGTGDEDSASTRAGNKSGSVLDRSEDRNFMRIAGKAIEHSAGYRNAGPPEAEL